jgi:hypothetical protein
MNDQKLAQMQAVLEKADEDIQKARKGNGAAGTRVRKCMQELKKQAQALRLEVLNWKK